MKTERAEAGKRITAPTTESRKYKGLARNPMALKWMLNRLADLRQNAAEARNDKEMDRWIAEGDHMAAQLRQCGVNVEAQR